MRTYAHTQRLIFPPSFFEKLLLDARRNAIAYTHAKKNERAHTHAKKNECARPRSRKKRTRPRTYAKFPSRAPKTPSRARKTRRGTCAPTHAINPSRARLRAPAHTRKNPCTRTHAHAHARGNFFPRVFCKISLRTRTRTRFASAPAQAHTRTRDPRARARARTHATRAHARTRGLFPQVFHRFSTGYAQVTGLIFPHSFFEKLRARLAYTRKTKNEQVFAFPQGANRCSLFHRLSTGPPVSKSYPQVIHRAGFAITKTDSAHLTYH